MLLPLILFSIEPLVYEQSTYGFRFYANSCSTARMLSTIPNERYAAIKLERMDCLMKSHAQERFQVQHELHNAFKFALLRHTELRK